MLSLYFSEFPHQCPRHVKLACCAAAVPKAVLLSAVVEETRQQPHMGKTNACWLNKRHVINHEQQQVRCNITIAEARACKLKTQYVARARTIRCSAIGAVELTGMTMVVNDSVGGDVKTCGSGD